MIYLNKSQIESILDEVRKSNPIKGLVKEANEKSLESLLRNIKIQLRLYKIKEKKIPFIAKKIIKQLTIIYHPDGSVTDMKIQEGSYVGVSATESIAQPVTQTTMKSSHNAGSQQSVGQTNQQVKEILMASKNRKQLFARIYFTKDFSFDEIYDKIPDIVSTTLKSLILNYTIEYYSDENIFWWHRLKHDSQEYEEGRLFIRFNLNQELMFERKVNIKLVAELIQKELESSKVLYSPNSLGIIDVVPDPDTINQSFGTTSDNNVMSYINTQILGMIEKMHIKGVRFIQSLFPVKIEVLGASIFEEVKQDISEGTWLIALNKKGMHQYGIPVSRLVSIFETFGYNVDIEEDFLVLSGLSAINSPVKDINEFLKKNENSILYKLCNLMTAETQGTNLREIFCLPDVDTTMTLSNDFNEMSEIFGIEATRIQMMRELTDIIKAFSVNGRHIILLGDLMTNIGELTAINYNGVVKQQKGIIAKVAYERGFATLSTNAGIGASDKYLDKNLINVCPTSTSIITGQMFPKIRNVETKPIDVLSKLRQMKKSGLVLTERGEEYIIENSGIEIGVMDVESKEEQDIEIKEVVESKESFNASELTTSREKFVTLSKIDADHLIFHTKMWNAKNSFKHFF